MPALAGPLEPGAGTVTRVSVGTASRADAPRTVTAPGHVVEVARTALAAEAHAITPDRGTPGRWELLVIPPHVPVAAAARLLTAAGPENLLPARRMPALAEDGVEGEAAWEAEAGHGLQ